MIRLPTIGLCITLLALAMGCTSTPPPQTGVSSATMADIAPGTATWVSMPGKEHPAWVTLEPLMVDGDLPFARKSEYRQSLLMGIERADEMLNKLSAQNGSATYRSASGADVAELRAKIAALRLRSDEVPGLSEEAWPEHRNRSQADYLSLKDALWPRLAATGPTPVGSVSSILVPVPLAPQP
jgi:hypothetical protein